MSVVIEVLPEGPLKVKGDFKIVNVDGSVTDTKRTAFLCGCGRSSKKPVCTGKHNCKDVRIE